MDDRGRARRVPRRPRRDRPACGRDAWPRWPALGADEREREFAFLEDTRDPALEERRTYRRLRGHLLHGYLTSERVRREVLKVNITPGHYRGDVPVAVRGGGDA
ncbi:MAG: hypothetical protein IPJ78_06310 [Gemmatimonadetes bacterium]|nr:hypothetical protein [Gemmatimonadota bacterium]